LLIKIIDHRHIYHCKAVLGKGGVNVCDLCCVYEEKTDIDQ